MNLTKRLKRGARDFGLLAVLAVSSAAAVSQTGCGYQRMGDVSVSYWLIPTIVTVKKYENETSNVVIEKEETSVSMFLGNVDAVVKRWERGKYAGKTRTIVRNAVDPRKTRTIIEEYDSNDRLIGEPKEERNY